MFKNVGNKIRIWAKVLVVLQMIPIAIGAVATAGSLISINEDFTVLGILAAIVILLLGYLIASLSAMFLYSWGEMVVRVTSIDEKLDRLQPPMPPMPEQFYAPAAYQPAPVQPVAPVSPIEVSFEPQPEEAYSAPVTQGWYCPVCGKQNPAIGKWCKNCGTKRENM